MKKILYTLSFIALLSCKNANNDSNSSSELAAQVTDITQKDDYQDHLFLDKQASLNDIDGQIKELRAIIEDKPQNILDLSKLASLLDQKFDLTGKVAFLNEAVSLREKVVKYTAIKPESAQRTLAQSYIKQHRFKKADSIVQALGKDYQSKETQYIMFDIAMELGYYDKAEKLLNALRNDSDYNYLIRAAKWNDYKGKLDNTILNMEKALQLANESGKTDWMLWSNSNIADYYGHDGQITKSYEHFLKTLEIDKGNNYALKGIAWIAYSNDAQPEEALQILQVLAENSATPDYDLLLSEIYAHTGDAKQSDQLRNSFLKKVSKGDYGDMYNAYLIDVLATGTKEERSRALEIAEAEVKNRATPETYDLLGYAMLMNDKESAALANHQEHVIGKTFEPVAQMHTAQIYRTNNMDEEANALISELKESRYELGPETIKIIEKI